MDLSEIHVHANGIDFAALAAGDGPLVLLLHGFPDNAHTWDHQLGALAQAGYRAVAPFIRGYHPTGVPADGRYDAAAAGADVAGVIEGLDAETAYVVGSDWGALATYAAMTLHPERVTRGVVINSPHPVRLFGLLEDPAQIHFAFHVWFFQLPQLAEAAVAANDYAFVDYLWRLWCPGFEDPTHIADVKRTLASAGTLPAALAYYRALIGAATDGTAPPEMLGPVPVPTLAIWGAHDPAMALVDGEEELFPAGYERVTIPDAGHFPQRERPAVVSEALVGWVRTGISQASVPTG